MCEMTARKRGLYMVVMHLLSLMLTQELPSSQRSLLALTWGSEEVLSTELPAIETLPMTAESRSVHPSGEDVLGGALELTSPGFGPLQKFIPCASQK